MRFFPDCRDVFFILTYYFSIYRSWKSNLIGFEPFLKLSSIFEKTLVKVLVLTNA